MPVKLSNNAESTLAASITNDAVTIAIQSTDAGNFPVLSEGEWHPATIKDASGNMEIVRVTSREGSTLTVVRGQEGTPAKSFTSGSRIAIRLTAAVVNLLARVAFSGSYNDLIDQPSFATTEQGEKADSAVQPSDLTTAMSEKVSKNGDEMAGNLTIENANPAVRLKDTTADKIRTLLNDNDKIGFTGPDGGWVFYVSDDGSMWSKQIGSVSSRIEERAEVWAKSVVSGLAYRLSSRGSTPVSTSVDVPIGAVSIGLQMISSTSFILFYRYPQIFDPVRGWVGFSNA